MSIPVSCFIITLNEADRLPRTIRALKGLVDEIIVVDAGSTDGTQRLAEAEGARVVHNKWQGFGQQKQFGEAQCRNTWILNVDSDEVVTPQLASELRRLFADGEPPQAAYGVWVQFVYPGQKEPRWLARDHYCVRLYDRRRSGFKGSALHDSVDARGQSVGHLAAPIHHYSFRSFPDLIAKCNARANYSAVHSAPKSQWLLGIRTVTEFPVNFFRYLIVRRHVMGGWPGVRVAAIMAWYRWTRVVRTRRYQRRRRSPDTNSKEWTGVVSLTQKPRMDRRRDCELAATRKSARKG